MVDGAEAALEEELAVSARAAVSGELICDGGLWSMAACVEADTNASCVGSLWLTGGRGGGGGGCSCRFCERGALALVAGAAEGRIGALRERAFRGRGGGGRQGGAGCAGGATVGRG